MGTDEHRPIEFTFSPHTSWRFDGRRDIEPPRELTTEERKLLDFLLEPEFPGRDELREQAKDVQVWGVCTCGCRSMNLQVLESSPKATVNARVPVEANFQSDESPTGILLHVVDGRMIELEFVEYDPVIKGVFPPLAQLERFMPGVTKIWSDE
jgi:hypothetical protein